MNKLIKEAEELYKQIDKAQVHLINTRLNNDEEGKKSAISEIETAMCNAMQLLKCFIEHKGNIVDLSEVWHTNKKIPKRDKYIIHKTENDSYDTYTFNYPFLWSGYACLNSIVKWAYIDDLLPKGAE